MVMIDAIHNNQFTSPDTLLPMYSSGFNNNRDVLNVEGDLTYSVSRKRSRDASSMFPLSQNIKQVDHRPSITFLSEDISSQIEMQQFEMDLYVAIHANKVREEIEERRKRNLTNLMTAMEEGLTQMLNAKEEEIVKMTKLNWLLEEKVRSMHIENQVWRELAQTNETTANALRCNLKQVLEQLVNGDYRTSMHEDNADDAQSCCKSNENEHVLAEQDGGNSDVMIKRMCKSCLKVESCVLLLPCRHLCLCTVCASSVHNCPICKSSKNISVQVHMS